MQSSNSFGTWKIVEIGIPKEVTKQYLATLYESTQDVKGVSNGDPEIQVAAELPDYRDMRESMINTSTLRNDIEVFRFSAEQLGFGTGDAKINSVHLLDENGIPLSWIVGGENVILDISCIANKEIYRPIIGFQFKDRLGQVIFSDNTFLSYREEHLTIKAGNTFNARFAFRLPILPSGDYSISPAVAEGTQEDHVQHHWIHDALIVRVHASSVCLGLLGIPMRKISLEVRT